MDSILKELTLEDVLERIYSHNNLTDWDDYEGLLYYYVEDKLQSYKKSIDIIAEKEFAIAPNDIFFNGDFTKKRLQNLVNRIVEICMQILQYCYKGDLFYASKLLYQLLVNQKTKLSQYLVEPYVNYMDSTMIRDERFYRIRDSEINEVVDNCSHVPYNLKKIVDSNRFSLQGLPCLYLADSIETANKETRELAEGKLRWESEFVPLKDFSVTDLRFNCLNIQHSIDAYDAFKLLITYPMRLLCSLKVKDNCHKFHEEYLFPQLLSHLILVYLKEHPNDKLYNGTEGIKFDSTQNEDGFNLIIPALYSGKEPPRYGHSPKIKELFEEQK